MDKPFWVLVYSVLLVTLFSGNLLECLVRLTSCTGFIMISYIDASYHFLSAIYKLWRTYLVSNSKVPYFNPQTQFAITFTIEVCIVISGLTFEWGMLFRSEIQWCYRDFTRQTIKFVRSRCMLTIFVVVVMDSALKLD